MNLILDATGIHPSEGFKDWAYVMSFGLQKTSSDYSVKNGL